MATYLRINRESDYIFLEKLQTEGSYFDLVVPFEVEPEKTYYLVYAEYTTGDSFGSTSGHICWIDLFATELKANDAMDAALADPPDGATWESRYSFKYTDEAGNESTGSRPWVGYFEHLDKMEVLAVRLSNSRKRWTRPGY
jgi:hypothetical protein